MSVRLNKMFSQSPHFILKCLIAVVSLFHACDVWDCTLSALHAVAEELSLFISFPRSLCLNHVERGKLIRVAQPWKLRSGGAGVRVRGG